MPSTPAPLNALTLCNACEAEQANPRCPAGYCDDEGCGCPTHVAATRAELAAIANELADNVLGS